jgi:hypothetical protein
MFLSFLLIYGCNMDSRLQMLYSQYQTMPGHHFDFDGDGAYIHSENLLLLLKMGVATGAD